MELHENEWGNFFHNEKREIQTDINCIAVFWNTVMTADHKFYDNRHFFLQISKYQPIKALS